MHGKERSPDIDIEELVEMRLRDLFQRGKLGYSNVGKEHINSPLLTHGFVEAIKVGQIGNVALHASNIASDCIHSLVKFLLAAPRDENVGTLLTKSWAAATLFR